MAALTEEMSSGTTEQEIRLHIFSVNLNGVPANGKKVIEELQRLESANRAVDVVFLTETHVKDIEAWTMFMDKWEIFSTAYDSRTPGCYNKSKRKITKGAAILLKKEKCFTDIQPNIDKSGRYVIVHCKISGRSYTFVSVYHHSEERGLLKELSKKINPQYTDILVVGGDFNTALDKIKDTTSTSKNRNHKGIRIELQHFLDKHGLIDAWREKNPDKREYTYKFKEKGEDYYSRLDYFFINADKWGLVKDCRINDYISDHRSVSLDLKTPKLKILSCTVHDLRRDEDLANLCPDIILLAKGQAEHEDYITKLKEEEEREEKIWNVLWSRQSNAAILVAERQRDIHILFTVYNEHYVILHCIVLGMLHTFVSVYHPTEGDLQNMWQEIKPSYSGRRVIGGDFSTSEQTITELMNRNEFNILEGGSTQLRYFIHAQLGRACEIREQTISGRPYSSLILHLPEMNPKDADNIIRSLGQLKIHH